MKLIAPSILAADFSNLAQQIRMAEIGGADIIHCDVMDGQFVPNITFGPIIVNAAKRVSERPLDVHLMIEKPYDYVEEFVKAGANSVTVHYEAARHLNRVIQKIKELGAKAGVALNPATPVHVLKDIAEYVDMVLIMSVNPGFGGQTFIPNSLRKIRDAVLLREELNAKFLIEVDGGISRDTIRSISNAGCDVFVAGTSIFKEDNISAATAELRNMLNTIEV
ncbi:MAG: ribulose-phosphate 3-epimerase [Ignavibacteriaceae bacterium]